MLLLVFLSEFFHRYLDTGHETVNINGPILSKNSLVDGEPGFCLHAFYYPRLTQNQKEIGLFFYLGAEHAYRLLLHEDFE